MNLDLLGPWGLLPVAAPLLVAVAVLLARRVLPPGQPPEPLEDVDRLAATGVLAMATVHATIGLLGTLGMLSTGAVLGLTAAALLALLGTGARPDLRGAASALAGVGRAAWPGLALGLAVLVAAAATARLLPVWQWDAIGYHLPFVNLVIQSHGFQGVPPDVHYTSTYPHDMELGMVWLRLMLPDDRLVDLAQVPHGLVGALLAAAAARRLGAEVGLAALAGAAWLSLPAVFLQLPTNYVDVGTAAALLGAVYFLVLGPCTPRRVLVGALALGLFLGSKPSAPLATALLGSLAAWRCVRAGHWRAVGLLVAVTGVLGAEMYAVMWLRHGNPVWPVALQLGPLRLPGDHAMEELLASGAAVPHATGNVLQRLGVSWLALDANPVFDMKVGGLGLPFLLALPLAIAGLVRRRSLLLGLALAATLLSPDPAIARYVLAFGALVLALAVATAQGVPWLRRLAPAVLLAAAGWQLQASWPGLVGDGPDWMACWGQTDEQRRVAVGPHGRPTGYPEAQALVRAGEAVAFDADFEFPGLLWAPDLRFPVYLVPPAVTPGGSGRWLEERRVRVLAVGARHRGLVEAEPGRWRKLFDCRSADCAVYARQDQVGPLAVGGSGVTAR